MPSFTTLWQAVADALDDRETVTLSAGAAGPPVTMTSLALVNLATGVTSSLYEGRWVYNLTKVTQSKAYLYVPATGVVTLTPTVTTPATSDVVSLTSLFPVLHTVGADTDYLTICNRALARMMLEVEVEIACTTADAYPMTAFPSLDRPERLRQVREPSPVTGRAPIDSMWRRWELVPDPPTASLRTQVPFAVATGNISVEWTRPASTWIAVPTTFAESAVGLVNATDQAQPSAEEFLPFGLEEALTVLIARSPGRPSAEWERMLAKARSDIGASRYRDRTQMVEQAPSPAGRAA